MAYHLKERTREVDLDVMIGTVAEQVADQYSNNVLHWIVILQGASFFSDALKSKIALLDNRPSKIVEDSIGVESYRGGATTNKQPKIVKKLDHPEAIRGQDVLLVEDIVHSGLTMLLATLPYVWAQKPASVKIVSMLTHNSERYPRAKDVTVDFSCLDIDYFVVGSGLDFDSKYRNLPGLHEVVEEK